MYVVSLFIDADIVSCGAPTHNLLLSNLWSLTRCVHQSPILALQIQQLVPIKLEAWGSNQEVIAYILLMNPLGRFNLTYHQPT